MNVNPMKKKWASISVPSSLSFSLPLYPHSGLIQGLLMVGKPLQLPGAQYGLYVTWCSRLWKAALKCCWAVCCKWLKCDPRTFGKVNSWENWTHDDNTAHKQVNNSCLVCHPQTMPCPLWTNNLVHLNELIKLKKKKKGLDGLMHEMLLNWNHVLSLVLLWLNMHVNVPLLQLT